MGVRDGFEGLRNQFTHGAVTPTTVSRMDDGTRLEIIEMNGDEHRVKIPFRHVQGRIDKEGIHLVADWPFVLYETVAAAIGEPVPAWESTHTLIVMFPDRSGGTIEGVSREDFKDPSRRGKILADAEGLRQWVPQAPSGKPHPGVFGPAGRKVCS